MGSKPMRYFINRKTGEPVAVPRDRIEGITEAELGRILHLELSEVLSCQYREAEKEYRRKIKQ